MIIAYVIEDGTTNKVKVSNDHLRSFAVESSLMNYISSAINNPSTSSKSQAQSMLAGTGVFTSRANISVPSLTTVTPIFIKNIDPNNLLIIDRVFVTTYQSSISKIANNIFAEVLFAQGFIPGTGVNLPPVNLNKSTKSTSSTNTPNIILLANPTVINPFGSLGRVYLTLGDTIELIQKSSNSVILKNGEMIEINIDNVSSFSIQVEAYIRFALA